MAYGRSGTGDVAVRTAEPDTPRARRPGFPLLRRSTGWGVRHRAWSLLVVLVFTVLATAGAASPMFGEASDNAAFEGARTAVPAGARQSDAAAVRLTGSASPASADQLDVLDDLRAVRGLSAPVLNGKSVGVELARPGRWESFVVTPGGAEPARLFAVDDPAAHLVPAEPAGAGAAPDGLWLPAPLAARLGVRAGDTITIRAGGDEAERQVTAPVAGTYRVAEDGRRPADRPGTDEWSLRRGELPADSALETRPAYLVIGDVAGTERLAAEVGDRMLWSVDAVLAPGLTLAEARAVAAEVDELTRRYVRGRAEDEVLARRVASGIGTLTEQAADVAQTVQRRTRPLEWAALSVALTALAAVAVASVRRRDVEVRHAAGAGLAPPLVALLWALEHLLPAVAAVGLGWLSAWASVTWLGPGGAVTAASLLPGLLFAAVAAVTGVALVAVVAGVAVARRVRPATPAGATRRVPWLVLVVATAVTATAGLAGADPAGAESRAVDLLVPLLVFVAAGALGAALLPVLLRRTRRRDRPGTATRPGALWFARRRLAAAVPGRAPVAAAVTAGLGMVLFALTAVTATEVNIADRVVVRTGAEAVASIDGSWQLDETPVSAPPAPGAGEPAPPDGLVPGVRTPPLPARTTVVWRIEVTNPTTFGNQDLLVVDPATVADAASWGRGPELTRARASVERLAAAEATAAENPRRARTAPLPVVAVGVTGVDVGEVVLLDAGAWRGQAEVVDVLDVFPRSGRGPMYVAPVRPTFDKLGVLDPRLKPQTRLRSGLFVRTELWGASDDTVDSVLTARAVRPQQVETADQARRRDVFVAAGQATAYQLAVGAYLAVLAVLALCVHAQRRAAADRPTDLMLARLGFGRSRVLLARAVDHLAVVATAVLCAVAGLLVLRPLAGRLVDVAPGEAPGPRLDLTPAALGVTVATALLAAVAATVLSRQPGGRSEEEAYRADA